MYTSYFSNLKYLPKDVVPIAICRTIPEWYDGAVYKKLAPSFELLMNYKSNHDKITYEYIFYKDVLSKLDVDDVIKELNILSKNNLWCLVCYEKSSSFCHRHLVRWWFNKLGFMCEEFERR